MIERGRRDPYYDTTGEPAAAGGAPSQIEGPGEASAGDDLYADLFASTASRSAIPRPRPRSRQSAWSPDLSSPTSLTDSGLTISQIADLILKQLYLHGNLLGVEFARNARLPFTVIDEGLQYLKAERCIEVASGDVIGRISYRFNLTDLGRMRAREAFEQCRYVGPAPVPLEAYVEQCRRQAVTGMDCTVDGLNEAFSELIIRPNLLDELGPAVCSGKSIFIYGPPGNGKTMIAKGLGKYLNRHGGEIYIPYAIHTENAIITLFDPTIHETTDDDIVRHSLGEGSGSHETEPGKLISTTLPDLRWRRIRRPVVITGGELTLDMLELQFAKTGNFYHAPLHIKANGGVFLIDDFGRQIVSPRDLLNRWILPLEERIDFLTLITGKKFAVPFEQLIVFSTNLDPRELVDEAFLRRIRHKIEIGPPDRGLFTDIFRLCCEQRGIVFNPACVDLLYKNFYEQGKSPRSSDPRDLLEIAQSISRFRQQPFVLTEKAIAEATERYFCQI